ncbi:hypothetical protein PYCC9005_004708 [Savitreella phatthalungensis]
MRIEEVRHKLHFAELCQFIILFSDVLNVHDFSVERLEKDLANDATDGEYAREIRLALIQSLSSNRNVTADNMDDFIRRQYTWRRQENPLLHVQRVWRSLSPSRDSRAGDESDSDSSLHDIAEVEEKQAIGWLEVDIDCRLSVLRDLCEWHLQSEKFRERANVASDREMVEWRIQPIGRDACNLLYYYLDDDRLYRGIDPFSPKRRPPSTAKTSVKKRKRASSTHSAKEVNAALEKAFDALVGHDNDGDWTCLATCFTEFSDLVQRLPKPRSDDEAELFSYLRDGLLPPMEEAEIEKQALAQKKEIERLKELQRLEAMANRKRSSRIQAKDQQRAEEEARDLERRRVAELEMQAEKARLEKIRREQAYQAQVVSPAPPRVTREARLRERALREFLRQQGEGDSAGLKNVEQRCLDDAISDHTLQDSGMTTPQMHEAEQKIVVPLAVAKSDEQSGNDWPPKHASKTDGTYKQDLAAADPVTTDRVQQLLRSAEEIAPAVNGTQDLKTPEEIEHDEAASEIQSRDPTQLSSPKAADKSIYRNCDATSDVAHDIARE